MFIKHKTTTYYVMIVFLYTLKLNEIFARTDTPVLY